MSIKKGIGYSPLGDAVYMGKQNTIKRMWVGQKEEITDQFIAVAFEYFPENTIREISSDSTTNLFINIPKTPEGIQRIIDNLTKQLKECQK
jgi:hypothetical protein